MERWKAILVVGAAAISSSLWVGQAQAAGLSTTVASVGGSASPSVALALFLAGVFATLRVRRR